MSKVCQVTGKKPQAGNNVSHAKNRNKRTFQPNLHKHRFWVESENRYVSLTVSANGMRTIPQIFFDDHHVGGYVELRELEKNGELNNLLK